MHCVIIECTNGKVDWVKRKAWTLFVPALLVFPTGRSERRRVSDGLHHGRPAGAERQRHGESGRPSCSHRTLLKSLKVANSLHLPLVRSCHVRILSQEEMFMLNKWLTFLERRSHLCGAGNKEMSNLLLTVSSACCLYCLRGCVSLAHALKAAQVSVSVILSFVGVLPCLHILLLSLTVTVFLCCDRTPWCRTAWTVWRKQWPASWTTCTPAPCCPTPSLWLETRRRGANSSHTCTTSPTRMVRQWYHQLR